MIASYHPLIPLHVSLGYLILHKELLSFYSEQRQVVTITNTDIGMI